MKKTYSKACFGIAFFLSCCLLSGCGCGKKKDVDPKASQVLKISITPNPTPTPDPVEAHPDSVVTNGNVTMVNEYLAGGQEN